MSTTILPPIPYNSPLTGSDGKITPIWSKWLEASYIRSGRAIAYPNDLLIANPMSNLGDTIYQGSTSIESLPGNLTETKKFLSQIGTFDASAAPIWNTLTSSDLPAVTTTPTASTYAGWDTHKNLSANNLINGYTTTATAAATTTLTVSSTGIQIFTGVTTQNCLLPDATTLVLGQQFYISNNSSGAVTVKDNGSSTVQVMAASTHALFTVTNILSAAGAWDFNYSAAGAGISQLTGDVTAGPGSGSQAATIAAGSVTLAKQANLAANSIIGNNTGSSATPIALTVAQVNALIGPMTTGGDIIYGGASGVPTRLANGSAGQVLTSSGTTVAPTWTTPASGSTWSASADTYNNFGSVTSSVGKSVASGVLRGRGSVAIGSPSASTASISLVTSINTTVWGSNQVVVGRYVGCDPGGSDSGYIFYDGSDATKLFFGTTSSGSTNISKQTATAVVNASDVLHVDYEYPI